MENNTYTIEEIQEVLEQMVHRAWEASVFTGKYGSDERKTAETVLNELRRFSRSLVNNLEKSKEIAK